MLDKINGLGLSSFWWVNAPCLKAAGVKVGISSGEGKRKR